MFKRILVPTDGSSLSEQAAVAAIDIARAVGGEIIALSIAQPHSVIAAEAVGVFDSQAETGVLLDHAQQHVDKVAQLATAAGVACTGATVLSTIPHEEIIKAAVEHQCDVIFMGSHGRRGISKLLAGSVTQNVLSYSTIPVLVLRPGEKN